ncbi:hypothetical protein [Microbacterium sp. VKM Ac-2923]|uniref:hypothetical protein n=1 Tax=Microbacterium sp. VKM Ac-2923 TaxID=2929476 RepID=UPI001FB36814|nr:hypothetical protein [Microbacterium sp. VKM Ac-2923]MCJ1707126.1 hypothetical protein [Microbacterium sp. VKM Ac-2923]
MSQPSGDGLTGKANPLYGLKGSLGWLECLGSFFDGLGGSNWRRMKHHVSCCSR